MYLTRAQHRIFYRRWEVNSSKGALVITHGLGEHSGRYQHLAKYFNTQGYSVFALDHRGHGQSEGKRGHVETFEDYGDDLHVLLTWVASQGFDGRIHLLGHSMGAVIATGYAIRYKNVASVILSSPGFRGKNTLPKYKLKIIYLLEKIVPKISFGNGLDVSGICRSKDVVENYLADPLVHDRISVRWFVAFVNEVHFINQHLKQLVSPCLMLLSVADLLVDYRVSESYFEKFSSSMKTIRHYPDAYHEIFNEVKESQLAFSEISQWLERFC